MRFNLGGHDTFRALISVMIGSLAFFGGYIMMILTIERIAQAVVGGLEISLFYGLPFGAVAFVMGSLMIVAALDPS